MTYSSSGIWDFFGVLKEGSEEFRELGDFVLVITFPVAMSGLGCRTGWGLRSLAGFSKICRLIKYNLLGFGFIFYSVQGQEKYEGSKYD